MPKVKSDTSELTLPVSPVEVAKGLDVDDPQFHDRTPRNAPRIARGYKEVEIKDGPDPDVLPAHLRKLRWPELFRIHYSVELIQSMRTAYPVDADIDTWVKECIASGVPEDQRGNFIVAMHPGARRLTLFELVSNPKHGTAYKAVSIFMTPAVEGYLPPDLDTTDKRWRHLRGCIGDFRRPTRRDFEIIREYGDRRTVTMDGATQGHAIGMKLEKDDKDRYNEIQRKVDDQVADLLDYSYLYINRAANNGTKQYSLTTITPQTNPLKWKLTKKDGYTVKERRSADDVASMLASIEENDKARRLRYGLGVRKTLDLGHAVEVAADRAELRAAQIHPHPEELSIMPMLNERPSSVDDEWIERRMAERRARAARMELERK